MGKGFIRLLAKGILLTFLSAILWVNVQGVVFAIDETNTTKSVLPEAASGVDCSKQYNPDIVGSAKVEEILSTGKSDEINNWLGCGIKTGNIKLYMLPYYVRSILEFIIGISGLICVGAIVFGGYWYLFAGVSDDKEKGKKAIEYGLIGMVLTLLAWGIVNIIISFLTM